MASWVVADNIHLAHMGTSRLAPGIHNVTPEQSKLLKARNLAPDAEYARTLEDPR